MVAVNDLILSLAPGVTGLVGSNGAEKSTLLKMLLGLDVAGQGTTLRSRLGQVPGHGCLPPDVSATELVVVRLGSSLRVRRAGRRRPSRVTPKRWR